MLERVHVVDVAQVYLLWNEFAAAASDGDLDRWMALWTDDAIQMLPGVPQTLGRADIRDQMQTLLRFHDAEITHQIEEVRVQGDQAYSHGSYTLTLSPMESEHCEHRIGHFLSILQKQADGSWKIIIDCRSSSTFPGHQGESMQMRATPGRACSMREKGGAVLSRT